ncbi:MAG: hypothetical protein U0452_14090, partial [Anaerolineae bacterium]
MTSAIYYPDQRQMLPLTLIRRERVLPEGVGDAHLETSIGARVGLRDILVRGFYPAPVQVLDGMALFKLRRASDLTDLLNVAIGDHVDVGQIVAHKGRRKMQSPVAGTVVLIEHGRILIEEEPEQVEVSAGVNGQVLEVDPARGVVVET